MPKRHVGSFFHVLIRNPADFDPLTTDFAVQVVIFFKYRGGISYKIITFKNLAASGLRLPVFRRSTSAVFYKTFLQKLILLNCSTYKVVKI